MLIRIENIYINTDGIKTITKCECTIGGIGGSYSYGIVVKMNDGSIGRRINYKTKKERDEAFDKIEEDIRRAVRDE